MIPASLGRYWFKLYLKDVHVAVASTHALKLARTNVRRINTSRVNLDRLKHYGLGRPNLSTAFSYATRLRVFGVK
jgi:hypothetical protein